MSETKYPNTLSNTLADLTETYGYHVNSVLAAFQTRYPEAQLSQKITQTMRNKVISLLQYSNTRKDG